MFWNEYRTIQEHGLIPDEPGMMLCVICKVEVVCCPRVKWYCHGCEDEYELWRISPDHYEFDLEAHAHLV